MIFVMEMDSNFSTSKHKQLRIKNQFQGIETSRRNLKVSELFGRRFEALEYWVIEQHIAHKDGKL